MTVRLTGSKEALQVINHNNDRLQAKLHARRQRRIHSQNR